VNVNSVDATLRTIVNVIAELAIRHLTPDRLGDTSARCRHVDQLDLRKAVQQACERWAPAARMQAGLPFPRGQMVAAWLASASLLADMVVQVKEYWVRSDVRGICVRPGDTTCYTMPMP
jgi:hypothetical protein